MVGPRGSCERVVVVSSMCGCGLARPVWLGTPRAGPRRQPSCGVHMLIVRPNGASHRSRKIDIRRYDMPDIACIVRLWPLHTFSDLTHPSSRPTLPHVGHRTARFAASILSQTVPGRLRFEGRLPVANEQPPIEQRRSLFPLAAGFPLRQFWTLCMAFGCGAVVPWRRGRVRWGRPPRGASDWVQSNTPSAIH
jgi:hypothetical protein